MFKQKRKVKIFVFTLILVLSTTLNAYADDSASILNPNSLTTGKITYHYTNSHLLDMTDQYNGVLIPAFLTVDIDLNAHLYFRSPTISTVRRTFYKEEYNMIVSCIGNEFFINQLSFSLGRLEAIDENGNAVICMKEYTPDYIVDPTNVYWDFVGSNTLFNTIRTNDSYATLGYRINGGLLNYQSGIATLDNLESENGIVDVYSINNNVKMVDVNQANLLAEKIRNRNNNEYQEKMYGDKYYKAVMNYAEKNNIVVSDNEIKDYMNKVIEQYKKDENHLTIKKACEIANIEFEQIVANDYSCYEFLLIEAKAYEKFSSELLKMNKIKSSESKECRNEIYNEWKKLME